MKIPVRHVEKLYHWGTLNPQNLGFNGKSHEGNALCASLCPEAWLEIVKLGGNTLNEMTLAGAQFIDCHALLEDKRFSKVKDLILEDAAAKGWIEEKTVFRAWFDGEDENDRSFFVMDTHEQALLEVDTEDDIEVVKQWVSTEALLEILGLDKAVANNGAESHVVMALALELAGQGLPIQGCYFDVPYEPESLKAPLFAINAQGVSAWQAKAVDWINDDDALELLPKISLLTIANPGNAKSPGIEPGP